MDSRQSTVSVKNILNVYLKKQIKRFKALNQTVASIELLFRHTEIDNSYGEMRRQSSPYSYPDLERLGDHIALSFKLANQCHQDFSSAYAEMKFDIGNQLTRFSYPEFAFFLQKKPLNLAEFKQLILNIKKQAEECHPNVHGVLGTLSILGENVSNKYAYNCTLYVQCGKDPVITPIPKAFEAGEDLEYKDIPNFNGKGDMRGYSELTNVILSLGIRVGNMIGNLLVIQTAAGTEVTVGIEICIDHHEAHMKNVYEELLNRPPGDRFIPRATHQLVISNWISLAAKDMVVSRVIQADTHNVGVYNINSESELSLTPKLCFNDSRQTQRNYNRLIEKKYSLTVIQVTQNYLQLVQPPFSGNLVVTAHSNPPSANHCRDSTLQHRIDLRNSIILIRQTMGLFKQLKTKSHVEEKQNEQIIAPHREVASKCGE